MIQHEPKSTSTPQGGRDVKHGAKKVARRVKQGATQAVNQVTEEAGSVLRQQKDMAADRIGAVGQAIRQTADNLDDDLGIHGLVEQAADRVDDFSQYLRDHEIREVVDGFERWARRNPALFLGGCFVAGLLVARFFKSSTADGQFESGRRGRSSKSDSRGFASGAGQDIEPGPGAGGSSHTNPSSQYGGSAAIKPGLSEPAPGALGSGPTASWEEP